MALPIVSVVDNAFVIGLEYLTFDMLSLDVGFGENSLYKIASSSVII